MDQTTCRCRSESSLIHDIDTSTELGHDAVVC